LLSARHDNTVTVMEIERLEYLLGDHSYTNSTGPAEEGKVY